MFCNRCGKLMEGDYCPDCGQRMLVRGRLTTGHAAEAAGDRRLLQTLRVIALVCAALVALMAAVMLIRR